MTTDRHRPAQFSAFVKLIVLPLLACTGFVYTGLTNTMPKLMEMGLSAALAASYTEIGISSGHFRLASLQYRADGDRYSARPYTYFLLRYHTVFRRSLSDVPLLVALLLVLSFMLAFAAAENMLVAHYTPFRWRSLAYGAKFVLALSIGGLTVHLAGWLFDRNGDFTALFTMFGAAAMIAAAAAFMLPGGRPKPFEAVGAD